MATNLTTVNSDFLFKLLQDEALDDEAFYRDHQLLSWCPNETDFTSHIGMDISVEYVAPQGAGTTSPIAASTRNPSAGVKFRIPQRHYSMNAGIERVVLQNAAQGGRESEFADALVDQIDGINAQFGDHLERQLWGTAFGYRGTVAAFTATSITLTRASDAQMFEVNQSIQAVMPGTPPTLRIGGIGKAVITSINRTTGVLGFVGLTTTGINDIANGDFLVGEGDFTNLVFNGLQDWAPITVSPTDNFLGVNRSIDRERLAGIYWDGSAATIRNACIASVQHAKTMSGPRFKKSSPMFIHPKNLQMLLESVEVAKIVNLELKTTYGVGLDAVEIMGHRYVEAYACPLNTAFLVGEGAFVRASSGKQPQIDSFGHGNSGYHYDPDTGLLTFAYSHDGNSFSRRPYHILRVSLPPYTP
jgi:hypothetical protein